MNENTPVHEVRSGRVKAAIWQNEPKDRPRYNVTFTRIYRSGDEWRDSQSFSVTDLSRVVEVAALAMRWIGLQGEAAADAQPAEVGPEGTEAIPTADANQTAVA